MTSSTAPSPEAAAPSALASAASPGVMPSTTVMQPRWRLLLRRLDAVFLLTVALPTLLAGLYYGVVASDVYVSESRFVVRSPQRQVSTGLGALLQGTAFSRSQDDTYSVHDFVRSRDALRELDAQLGVRAAYSNPAIDPVNRFPGLEWDDSFEALHRYYNRHVGIDYDSTSSISVLRVRAYTAQDAQRINELLLQMGERLVNHLNTRSRQDLIQVAESEVRAAEAKAREAALALAQFRQRGAVFDPNSQSALQLQGRARLQEELLAAEVQLAQVRQVSPQNPQIGVLAARVDALRKAVAEAGARVTAGSASLSGQSPAYDRLVLDKGFADRQLATALTALDTARSEAARKQLYLERLVQPNLPDDAVEPRRLRAVLTVLVVGLVLWGVVSLVLASIREHLD
jgi:capsular polysaccharide transport system permease protein